MFIVGVPHTANATVSQEAVSALLKAGTIIIAVNSSYSFKTVLQHDDMQAQHARVSKSSRWKMTPIN